MYNLIVYQIKTISASAVTKTPPHFFITEIDFFRSSIHNKAIKMPNNEPKAITIKMINNVSTILCPYYVTGATFLPA